MVFTVAKIFTASILSVLLMASPTSAASKAPTPNKLGIDIAWPQCDVKVPTDQAFGVVNVNGGLANNTSPCLKQQLQWGANSLGGTNQEKLQLYVNTANPGGLGTASWPKNNLDSNGVASPNPHGVCDNSDSLACAWQYGWNRSVEDVYDRFKPSATAAGINSEASTYLWWLDVETINTWKSSGSNFNYDSNVAVLEGMTAYFKQVNARVGLYSTGQQWKEITGNRISATSNLNGLPNWRPGGASSSTAKQACTAGPLTSGGKIVMTQFIAKNLDYDYSCID